MRDAACGGFRFSELDKNERNWAFVWVKHWGWAFGVGWGLGRSALGRVFFWTLAMNGPMVGINNYKAIGKILIFKLKFSGYALSAMGLWQAHF